VKPLLPKQHGAWAMLLVPFFLGMGLGQVSWIHIPLFIGWLFLYLATYPLLMCFKKRNKKRTLHMKWTAFYFVPVILSLIIVLLYDFRFVYFGLIMVPFFIINAYYAKQNDERALLNDLSAICSFGIGGVASYFGGTGSIDLMAYAVWGLSMLFFAGSTFFVKTMIREKSNPMYRWVSWGFHAGVILLFILSGYYLLTIAYLPSLIRAIYFYGKPITMMKVGVLEIANSAFFLIVVLLVI
jgi:hypothetical protein